jgi:hypothetical protein
VPHAQPPHASETNDEASGAHDFFPPVGNFNAVVPLSEIDADSESPITPTASVPTIKSHLVRAAIRDNSHEEQEETTLVPSRAGRASTPSRTATRRPSWSVMIAALALSLTAGLAAGVYLIKSSVPVELQAPASMTDGGAHDVAGAEEADGSRPTQVASESLPETKPQDETSPDAVASDVGAQASAEKAARDLNAPKSVTASDATSSRGERGPDTASAKAAVAERTPERHARKGAPSTANTPAPPEAVRTRRATSVAERTPVSRAPERSLPVSSPPSSAKSKRVIQWP